MSAYVPLVWANNQSPAINATNLNHIEQGIYQCSMDTISGATLSGSDANLTITLARQSGSNPISATLNLVSWLSVSAFYTQSYINACFEEHDAIDWDPPLPEED